MIEIWSVRQSPLVDRSSIFGGTKGSLLSHPTKKPSGLRRSPRADRKASKRNRRTSVSEFDLRDGGCVLPASIVLLQSNQRNAAGSSHPGRHRCGLPLTPVHSDRVATAVARKIGTVGTGDDKSKSHPFVPVSSPKTNARLVRQGSDSNLVRRRNPKDKLV